MKASARKLSLSLRFSLSALLMLFFAAASICVQAASPVRYAGIWPKSGRIVFQVKHGENGFEVGQSTHRWSHDGKTYRLSAETKTTGLAAMLRSSSAVQESHGVLVETGLQPLEFKSMRNGKTKENVRFNPEQHIIINTPGEQIPFQGTAQDKLSLFYQLGAFALDNPQITLKLMSGSNLQDYAVSVDAPQEIDSVLGKRSVRHLTVMVAGAGKTDDSTEVWLDTATRLPLKIRHRDRKGEVFDQVATAFELDKTE
jgi:hypothetical protein